MTSEPVTVSVRTFQGADNEKQQELIPDSAGLYLWTHDLSRFVGADKLHIQSNLKEILELVGKPRAKTVRPYYTVTIQDKRAPLHDSKRMMLHDAFASSDPFGTWLADAATRFQRPLYAGMSLNLIRRTKEHLAQGSTLRSRLEKAGADLLDLAITWVTAPAVAVPTDRDEQNEALEQRLRAAESLLIRLTMPMFNERQD
jgi:hypothetical protein